METLNKTQVDIIFRNVLQRMSEADFRGTKDGIVTIAFVDNKKTIYEFKIPTINPKVHVNIPEKDIKLTYKFSVEKFADEAAKAKLDKETIIQLVNCVIIIGGEIVRARRAA